MKKITVLAWLIFSTTIFAFAQDNGFVSAKNKVKGMMSEIETDSLDYSKKFVAKKLPATFAPPENLQYSMHYGFVTGAYAYATLTEEELNGVKVYHSVCKAKTVGIADMLFDVLDVYESYFVPETNLPVRAVRNISENGYKYYDEVDYFHDKHKIYSKRAKSYKSIPGGTLDLVSAFYYSRRVTFKQVKNVGDTVVISTYFDDRLFNLEVVFRGREVIKIDLGKIACMKFTPVVEKGRIFEDDDQFMFWVSDDQNYIPIRSQLNLMVGSFKVDLVKHSGLKYPLVFKK